MNRTFLQLHPDDNVAEAARKVLSRTGIPMGNGITDVLNPAGHKITLKRIDIQDLYSSTTRSSALPPKLYFRVSTFTPITCTYVISTGTMLPERIQKKPEAKKIKNLLRVLSALTAMSEPGT